MEVYASIHVSCLSVQFPFTSPPHVQTVFYGVHVKQVHSIKSSRGLRRAPTSSVSALWISLPSIAMHPSSFKLKYLYLSRLFSNKNRQISVLVMHACVSLYVFACACVCVCVCVCVVCACVCGCVHVHTTYSCKA